MARGRIELAASLLVLLSLVLPVVAQSTEVDVKARLKDKPLYLRGFWRDNTLQFSDSGTILSRSAPTSFTLSGFEFRNAHLKKDKLVIDGDRFGIEFVKDVVTRVRISDGMKIEIAAPANREFGPALDAIFANGLQEIAPALPSYWQSWVKAKILPPQSATGVAPSAKSFDGHIAGSDDELAAKKVAGAVHAPSLTAHREAQYTPTARQLRYSGAVLVGLVVSREGLPTRLHIVRPLGVGLDEQALVAVQAFVFSPATEDGKPVPVEVNVEVNFQIF